MSEMVRRNDPCPCGSGKKFKLCCIDTRDASAATPEAPGIAAGVETWKILVGGLALIAIVAGAMWAAGMPRTGQVIAGVGTLVLVMWCAFRSPPPKRKTPGDAAGINFGR